MLFRHTQKSTQAGTGYRRKIVFIAEEASPTEHRQEASRAQGSFSPPAVLEIPQFPGSFVPRHIAPGAHQGAAEVGGSQTRCPGEYRSGGASALRLMVVEALLLQSASTPHTVSTSSSASAGPRGF